jgi:hypothetical protein
VSANTPLKPRAALRLLIVGLVLALSTVILPSGCTTTSNPTNPSTNDDASEAKKGPVVEENADGSKKFAVTESLKSSFGAVSSLHAGQLVKAAFGNVSVYAMVPAGITIPNTKGWKTSVRSVDSAWNPDRCSAIQVHDAGDNLLWFETTVATSEGAQASPAQYQLVALSGVPSKTRFVSITPTPTSEVAFPRTLTVLGDGKVGYLWANGSLASPGSPTERLVPGATAPTALSDTGGNEKRADQISWRTIDTRTWNFVDTPMNVPVSEITGVESYENVVTFNTASAGFLTVDLSNGNIKASTVPPSSPEVDIDRAALPPGAVDIHVLRKVEQRSIVRFIHNTGGVSTGVVGGLADGVFWPSPFEADQQACVISR